MKFWNQYPLLRLLLPFIFGILLSYYFPYISDIWWLIGIVFIITAFWIFRPKWLQQFRYRFITGLIIPFLFIFLGYGLSMVKSEKQQAHHYLHIDSISHLIVQINSPIIEKNKSFKTTAQIVGVYRNNENQAISANGTLLLYFKKSEGFHLKYGDEILMNTDKMSGIENFGNPNEFDYQEYLKRQNIFHQAYLYETDWVLSSHYEPNILINWTIKVRDMLIGILKSFDFSESEFAVGAAILLGYDEFLDSDLRQLYAGSGAMHILCVSGLHVGIIFLILNTLFKPIDRIKYGMYLKAILIILTIWFYALITGLSPSVFRSATMFTFITFGGLFNRKTSTYNSLMASAFVLLVADPYILFHIGFQLSYSAVLAILLFQPRISSLVKTDKLLFRKTWDLVAVSIAAQIGTFPLAIYYFHQFPNYFFLTNLLVIPASFVILISGFFTLIMQLIGAGATWFGFLGSHILEASLLFLNKSVNLINQLPYAVSHDLFFSLYDTMLIYLIIICLLCLIIMKKAVFLFALLSSFILMMVTNTFVRFQKAQEDTLIIYHIPKASLIEIQKGRNSIMLMDSSLYLLEDRFRYSRNLKLSNRIKSHQEILLDTLLDNSLINNCLKFGGKSIFILDQQLMVPGNKNHIDYVLLKNNSRINLSKLKESINFDTLLFDGSNSFWKIEKWKSSCDTLGITYYDITKRGAFILKSSSRSI